MRQFGVLEGMDRSVNQPELEFLPTFTGISFGALDTDNGEFRPAPSPRAGSASSTVSPPISPLIHVEPGLLSD